MALPVPSSTIRGEESRNQFLDQAYTRVTGARAIAGNRIDLLRDGRENYPAWLEEIASARTRIHFEAYILHADRAGREFASLLNERARAGVAVRVLYDWLGACGWPRWGFWRDLRAAGVEVRCFNPPAVGSPFGWVSRDHRKCLVVDGRVAFVSGLCVGDDWVGDAARGVAPWRDTGVRIEGPATGAVDAAFADMWALAGPPLPSEDVAIHRTPGAPAGRAQLRIIATQPAAAGLFRLDQIVAAAAERSLWLTDAYFVAATSYIEALCAAARDGVDVRLLVPQASDIPGLRALSRAGYRPLLEAGVRVFEWNGRMLHAKTAVADGRWARVGSTNLNAASWWGNWELDVAAEDEPFARTMEAMYEDDLRRATEIVLNPRQRVDPTSPRARRHVHRRGRGAAIAGAFGVRSTIGAAITNRRTLGPAEARVLGVAGALLFAVAAAISWWPRLAAVPMAIVAAWIAVALVLRAWKLHSHRDQKIVE
jgi:cardiolipin synthase A/B